MIYRMKKPSNFYHHYNQTPMWHPRTSKPASWHQFHATFRGTHRTVTASTWSCSTVSKWAPVRLGWARSGCKVLLRPPCTGVRCVSSNQGLCWKRNRSRAGRTLRRCLKVLVEFCSAVAGQYFSENYTLSRSSRSSIECAMRTGTSGGHLAGHVATSEDATETAVTSGCCCLPRRFLQPFCTVDKVTFC